MASPESILANLLDEFAQYLSDLCAHTPGSTAKSRAWNLADAAIRLGQIEKARISLGKRVGLMIGQFLTDAIRKGKRTAYFAAKAAAGQLIEKFGAIPPSSSLIVPPSSFAVKVTFSRVDTEAVRILATDTYNDIAKVARTTAARGGAVIKAMAQRGVTNEEVNKIISDGILRGQRDEPIRQLRKQLEAIHGKTMTLIDKNGKPRETDTANYASLVVRTRTREAEEESRHRQLQDFGCDLVVVVGPMSGDLCEEFVNKVFSLSGRDPKYPALSSTPGGGPPFHPNCRHSTSIFVPELATPAQVKASTIGDDEKKLLGLSPHAATRVYKDLQLGQENRQKDRAVKQSVGGTNLTPDRTFKKPDLRNPDPHNVSISADSADLAKAQSNWQRQAEKMSKPALERAIASREKFASATPDASALLALQILRAELAKRNK